MTTLPAGRYIIGDLCYRGDEIWDSMISSIDFGRKGTVRDAYEGTEHQFIILSTKYGDGCYEDSNLATYAVDSGTIGIMSWPTGANLNHQSGRVVNFAEEFQVYSEGGKLHFGHVVIDTDPVQ
jgi:hypothetical protein